MYKDLYKPRSSVWDGELGAEHRRVPDTHKTWQSVLPTQAHGLWNPQALKS